LKHIKKYISLLITMTIILIATFPLTACNKDKTDNSIKKITLCEVTHSIFYAPQYVAIENGYFADEGLELTVTNGFGAMLSTLPDLHSVPAISLSEGKPMIILNGLNLKEKL